MFAVFVLRTDIYWFIDIISIWKDCSKDGKVGWWLENLAILWSNNPNLGFSPSLSTVYFPLLLKLGDFILIQISCQFIAQWFHHKVDQAGNRTSPRRAIFKILLIWSSLQVITFSSFDNTRKSALVVSTSKLVVAFARLLSLVTCECVQPWCAQLKTAPHWMHIILLKSSLCEFEIALLSSEGWLVTSFKQNLGFQGHTDV